MGLEIVSYAKLETGDEYVGDHAHDRYVQIGSPNIVPAEMRICYFTKEVIYDGISLSC